MPQQLQFHHNELDNGIILSSNLGYVTTIVQRDDEI